MALKAYFIQYKFILPESIKHSEYTYQKLFRALYGYTQNVTKSNGKTYVYHRKGVLSDAPYLRVGKNSVVIHPSVFSKLKSFFNTGNNPTHKWNIKGDWKAVYYMDEKDVDEIKAAKALEEMLERFYVPNAEKGHEKLTSEMNIVIAKSKNNESVDANYKKHLVDTASQISQMDWFKTCATKSTILVEFNEKLKHLKSL